MYFPTKNISSGNWTCCGKTESKKSQSIKDAEQSTLNIISNSTLNPRRDTNIELVPISNNIPIGPINENNLNFVSNSNPKSNVDPTSNFRNRDTPPTPPFPYFFCDYCQKISDTCYFCYIQPCNFERKIHQFELYNKPNGLTIQQVVKNCDKSYIYEENIDNLNKIYDPYITRCKIENVFVKGKKLKKDHPGFCRYCCLVENNWDVNFYERNNSRYRGHMINTHGIHPNGNRCKLPENGVFCYKWIRNHWFETSGFYCPYPTCTETFTIGEKGHGFHEYLRHWSKRHTNESS